PSDRTPTASHFPPIGRRARNPPALLPISSFQKPGSSLPKAATHAKNPPPPSLEEAPQESGVEA
ncbi:hypothetical protein U9M48_009906, partial [Paspalum notatum var. saurae]